MDAITLHNLGVSHFRARRLAEAAEYFNRAASQGGTASYKALFSTLIDSHRFSDAWDAARTYVKQIPEDFEFVNHFFHEVYAYALKHRPEYQPLPVTATPFLSFVICSHRDERFASVSAEIARAAGDYPHEVIRIADAVSMGDGYQRGFDQSKGEIVVLCHDDIAFPIPDFVPRLLQALDGADMVGVAGSRRMSGPAMLFDGHPHIIGRVISPNSLSSEGGTSGAHYLAISSMTDLRATAQVLDGVFIAARRDLLTTLGFDKSIPNFHYYDIDLSFRAHLAGARVIVATDLTLYHHSKGNFDSKWEESRSAFARKFPSLNGVPGKARHWYQVVFDELSLVPGLAQAFNEALSS